MTELVAHLLAQGYRRIGGLFGSTSTTATERRDGYLAAMQAHSLAPDHREIEPTAEAAIATVGPWLAQPDRPRALVASNNLLLMGALKATRAAALSIPDQLALAGFDNGRWTELVEAGISVVEQPIEEMSRVALSLLLERMKSPALPVRRLVMTACCMLRGSTRNAESPRAVRQALSLSTSRRACTCASSQSQSTCASSALPVVAWTSSWRWSSLRSSATA
jgi:LacI family fructose operon transcriptional repressor